MGGSFLRTRVKFWIGLIIASLFVITIIISYENYKKFEKAKYVYNRNCYYRIESTVIKTEQMINELQKICKSSNVSKESILRLRYLESSIGSEVTYLNLEVDDYQWKINKINGFSYSSGMSGMVIEAYFNYIEKNYNNESYIDLKKEADSLKYILQYYEGIRKVIYNDSNDTNFEKKFKTDIIEKDSWIEIVSRLNKFETDFNYKNRNKILVNS
mgnify:CR=1 FL=1